jgi:predicted transposase YdaD
MVLSGTYEYKTEFARKHFQQGREEGLEQGRREGREEGREEGRHEGLRQALARVLEARAILDEAARARIAEESGRETLELWLARAATASTSEDVFGP